MQASFDSVELTEPLASVHTDETAPQVLCAHPYGAELLVAFSGDVAVYVVTANDASTQLAETEESDAPPPEASAPYRISPRDLDDASGTATRVTLATCDVKCAAFSPDGASLAVGLESGEVRLFAWPTLEPSDAGFTTQGRPVGGSGAGSPARCTAASGVGMPASTNRRLLIVLSIATALARIPEAV